MNEYRFDDAYQKVYEYDGFGCYIYAGTYNLYGIITTMSDDEKEELVRRYENACNQNTN